MGRPSPGGVYARLAPRRPPHWRGGRLTQITVVLNWFEELRERELMSDAVTRLNAALEGLVAGDVDLCLLPWTATRPSSN